MKMPTLPAEWSDPSPDPEARCRLLRTKMMHVTSDWESHAAGHPSSSAAYWCLKTMGPVGPDEKPCHLADCRDARGCYEAAD